MASKITDALRKIDIDQVMSYRTPKKVKMIDFRLGLLNNCVMGMIMFYVVVWVLLIKKGYLKSEIALGQVELQVLGKAHFVEDGKDYLVDGVDMTDPAIEHGAIFVISRSETVRQTRGVCGNPFLECDADEDCPKDLPIAEGECVEGLCKELGWCPPPDIADDHTHVLQYDGTEELVLWIRAAISFPDLDPNVTFTTMNDERPIFYEDNPGQVNAYRIRELFEQAGVEVEAVKQDGCFLSIRMSWDCLLDTGEGCYAPNVQVKRLDVGTVAGFEIEDGDYRRHPSLDPGKEYRFYQRLVGYRMVVASKGTGYKTATAAIVMQLSAGIALLGLSKTVCDACLKYVLPEKEHYKQYKFQVTPDFSDLRDKITDESATEKKLRSRGSRYKQMFPGT